MNYSAINIQGNIISSEVLEKIRIEDIRYQTAKDFQLDPHTSVRDEISLAWSLAISHWNAFKQKREKLSAIDTGTTDTRKYWMKPLLGIIGYELSTATAEELHGKSYAISFRASNRDDFPVHLVGINQSLDARAESGGPRLSPHALLQEYLNNQEQYLYGLVSNGKFLRLLRDATKLSRLSYIEFNLEQIMEESLYAEFALLFRLLHATRTPGTKDAGAESIIEFYHQEALASGSRIRERLCIAVETSIKELANGFLHQAGNEDLRAAIAIGFLDAKTYYLYNLRVIYRLLFLMVIEERKLIYPDERSEQLEQQRQVYYNYYSIQRICKLVEKSIYVDPKKTDLWQSVITCFALFEQAKYGNSLGIAPLGSGLFALDALGILEEQVLNNETVLKVLGNLVTFYNENGQRARVNYADLDVEEFGSVYEGLLEYEPILQNADTQPTFLFKEGNERSKSGSHYTPEELVKPLIQHSLDYLIADRLKEKNPGEALLSLKVCDVACGSGHILLSAARRIGFELAKLRGKEDQPAPTVLRHAIRDVINNCIYGVDKNPLAVELCKVAMWLEAHNPGEPLNFLDHHIKCGDAIVGLAYREELEKGIADEAFKTLPGDEKEIASAFAKRNKEERKRIAPKGAGQQLNTEQQIENSLQESVTEYKTFSKLPEATPEQIERKVKAYRKFLDGKGFAFLKALADTQVAQFFISKTAANKDCLMTDADFRLMLSGYKGWQDKRVAKATAVAEEKRLFHWFLEFPEVFNEGGFDCVLGNPPYLGGLRISTNFGDSYLGYLKLNFLPNSTTTDLVAYFIRRIFSVLWRNSFMSIITTNTISQGDTRLASFDVLYKQNAQLNFAMSSIRWPGVANLNVSLFSLYKGLWAKEFVLNGKKVGYISTYFSDNTTLEEPKSLFRNKDKVFNGSYYLGDGFVITNSERDRFICSSKDNQDVIFPLLIGNDVNEKFDQSPSSFIINFFDWPFEKAAKYTEPFERIRNLVKPFRDSNKRAVYREKWWIYGERRVGLYENLEKLENCFVITATTKYLNFLRQKTDKIFAKSLYVFTIDDFLEYSIYQSGLHELWARLYSSTLADTLSYTPSTCFESFPCPGDTSEIKKTQLRKIGEEHHEFRKRLLNLLKLGITKSYNAFHSPDIKQDFPARELQALDKKAIEKQCGKEVWNLWNHLQKTPGTCSIEEVITGIIKLRELHVQMDNAVLDAYGWSDIQLRHGFYEVDYLPENDRVRYTIHHDARKEVLKRLLALNHKIYEEEVKAGLWDKTGKKKRYGGGNEISRLDEPDSSYGGLFNQK